jgi:hypothetical protein
VTRQLHNEREEGMMMKSLFEEKWRKRETMGREHHQNCQE